MSHKYAKQTIPLAALVALASIQCRDKIDAEALESYKLIATDHFAKGAQSPFPNPKVVKTTDGRLLIAAGFSRNKALAAAGYQAVECDVTEGDEDDAFKIGLASNLEHGSRLTKEDCVRSLNRLLKIDEYKNASNVELGNLVGKSENWIRKNRPAGKDTGVRTVTRGGKKIEVKVGNTGKGKTEAGKAAKAKKDEDKKAKKAGKSEAKKPAADKKGGADKTPEGPKIDAEYEKALVKIVGAIDNAKIGIVGANVRKAIEDASLPLSKADVKAWALTSADRIAKIAPLIVVNRWTPRQAFSFIDKVTDSTTKVDALINLAVAGSGLAIQKVDGYTIYVVEDAKYDFERNYQLGTHGFKPKAK